MFKKRNRFKKLIKVSHLELVVLVSEFPGRYETILIFILIFEDVIHHHFMMCVIRRVAMFLKLLLQVFFHLRSEQK